MRFRWSALEWPAAANVLTSDSPSRGRHDAAAAICGDPAAAAPLRRVVVHPEIVPQLVGQGDCSPQRVV